MDERYDMEERVPADVRYRGSDERHSLPVPVDVDLEPEGHGVIGYTAMILASIFSVLLLPFTIWFTFGIIHSYERGVVLRLGKLTQSDTNPIRGSGIIFKFPFIDTLMKVDTRTRIVDIQPQEILTKDSVTVKVDAIIYIHVVDTALALLRVEDWEKSANMLAVSMVRKILGKYKLTELLTARDEIDSALLSNLDQATDKWGIKVERVEITDIVLPADLQRAMAAEAQATRSAKAKIIEAQGELDASVMLRKAAEEMDATPSALQLRLLQTLATIATEQNSTIVFPLPVELLSLVGKRTQ